MEGKKDIVIGGGNTALSAAHWLTRQNVATEVIERMSEAGGLARTIRRDGFRYDFGGYRFFSRAPEIQSLLSELLGADLVTVRASSKIWHRGRLYEYPLQARDLYEGLGSQKAALALWTYAGTRAASLIRRGRMFNLEDWLLNEFGETLFLSFFKDYNEKVWGLPCHKLAADLASERIRGLSVGAGFARMALPSRLRAWLPAPRPAHRFLYPRFGIGELTERMSASIRARNAIRTDATVTEVRVVRARVESVVYRDAEEKDVVAGATDVISSMPLPRLLYVLDPRPPADVLASARSLVFRDLVAVCLEIARERVTEDSWIYVPEPEIRFARLLEPKNWSPDMAPPDRTSLVAEHYCFEGDATWAMSDEALVARTVAHLADDMKLISRGEVTGGTVMRFKKPYPVYEVGYREHLIRIQRFLKTIVNLQTVGRGGMFKYYNVAHLVECGIRAAENVFGAGHDIAGVPVDGVESQRFRLREWV